VARLHALDPDCTFFLQQNPAVIDAGAFHNDVIATSHHDVLLYHELAFIDADAELERLERTYERLLRSRSLTAEAVFCGARAPLPNKLLMA
jgi:succinylarginine dihydrolase